MKVKRKKVDKVPYIVTDYKYNDEEVGFNLINLNDSKIFKRTNIDGVPIISEETYYNNSSNRITLNASLLNEDDKIKVKATAVYPNKELEYTRVISDEVFVKDVIETCLEQGKSIKTIPCFLDAIDSITKEISDNALENDMFIKSKYMNYKTYIYNKDLVLLGTANRLSNVSASQIILCEYIGKNIESSETDYLIIDICVTEDITLRLKNAVFMESTNGSVSYLDINCYHAYIHKAKDNYQAIEYKNKNTMKFPDFDYEVKIEDYANSFFTLNTKSAITDFFKKNKPSANTYININRYLL